jgi:hypothetical protein
VTPPPLELLPSKEFAQKNSRTPLPLPDPYLEFNYCASLKLTYQVESVIRMSQNPQRRFEPAGVSQKVEEKEEVLAALHRADQLPTGLGRVMAVLFLSFDIAN